MMNRKLAVGGVIAGLLLGAWGFTHRTEPRQRVSTAATSEISLDAPAQGMQPIDDVVALWQQRVDEQPLDYLSRTKLGDAFTRRGRAQADLDDHERAEAAHRDALTLNPDHRPAQLGLATALMAQHRFTEARDLVEVAVADEPRSPAAVALLGDASFELGDYAAASDHYRTLVTLDGGAPALARLARLAAVQTTPAEAVAIATDALEAADLDALSPTDAAFYWFQLGHHRFGAGDTEGSVTALETALALDPDNPAATETLAFVLASTGPIDDALAHYEQLVQAGAAADVEGLYADLLATQGRHGEAAEHERRATDLAAETADRYPAERRHLVGFYLTRDPARAVELARADLAERGDIGAHDALAWALFHAGELEEAAAAIDRALIEGTRDSSLRYHAAAIAAASGDRDSAIEHLRIVQELNPHFHPTEGPAAAALARDLDAVGRGT